MSGLIAALQTGAMIVGATAATAGSISSFSQANKQKKRMQAAEREAKKAMDDARKRIDVNVMEQLSIQKEPYELAREASLVAGTQALQAGVEGSQRGAAATAGRVFMGQQDAQGKIRAAMGQEMGDINRAVVAEEGRLLDIGMGLSLEEVAGAQAAAANAEALRAQAIQQGFEGLTQAASTVYEGAPLYGGGGGDALNPRSMGANKDMLTRRQRAPYLEAMEAYDASQRSLGQSVFQGTDFSSVGGVNTIGDRIGTGGQLSPEQLEALRMRIMQDPNITGGFVQ
jgi:hypothetical protein